METLRESLEQYLARLRLADRASKQSPTEQRRPLPDGVADLDESRIPAGTLERLRIHASKGEWPLYLKGEVGRGKSYTAAAVYRRWTGTAVWMNFFDFCDRAMRLAKDGELSMYVNGTAVEYTRENWWRGIVSVGLVVIDEIGSGKSHEWRNEALWNLLEKRKGRPLILTGNIDLDGLGEKFDERIQSRIAAGAPVTFQGRDMRLDGLAARSSVVSVE